MARIIVTSDDYLKCGELADVDETIGDLESREDAATCIATIATLIKGCRRGEMRNGHGVLIQLLKGRDS